MRFSISAIAAFATTFAFVNAQDISGVPGCALPCFVTAVQGSGCTIADTKCQCTTGRESITNSLLQCAPAKCSPQDLASIASAVQKTCASVGVTISNLPSSLPTATSAGNSTVNGTAASRTASRTPTGTSPAMVSGNAAAANIAGLGAIAMGLALAL